MLIEHDRGTLLLHSQKGDFVLAAELPGVIWDDRVAVFRAPGRMLRPILERLERLGQAVSGAAASERRTRPGAWSSDFGLRPHQDGALAAWLPERAGVVVLPTGSGKTRLACAAMAALGVATLVLVPTRVLMHQWAHEIGLWYRGAVGSIGDGMRQIESVSVATYASLWQDAGGLADAFDMVVVDEAHHVASPRLADVLDLAPARYRLGLTATPVDGTDAAGLAARIGPVVFEMKPADLAGTALAPWDRILLPVTLGAESAAAYGADYALFRASWTAFARIHGGLGTAGVGKVWGLFLRACQQSPGGQAAVAAHRRCLHRVRYPAEKRRVLGRVLERHLADRVIVFADGNDTVYAIAREHLLAPITCDIGSNERAALLDAFRAGTIGALVSSQVLNEGIDVPAADVAVVLGGSGGAREHIQRVGRVLRPAPGKRATIYEIVVAGTLDSARADRRNRALSEGNAVHG